MSRWLTNMCDDESKNNTLKLYLKRFLKVLSWIMSIKAIHYV